MNHRSYTSLLCNCINHLLSKTLKRKIEAIILINEVNALGTTGGWNMVCYLSCLLWTLCFTVLMWILDTNKHNQRQPHTITSQASSKGRLSQLRKAFICSGVHLSLVPSTSPELSTILNCLVRMLWDFTREKPVSLLSLHKILTPFHAWFCLLVI